MKAKKYFWGIIGGITTLALVVILFQARPQPTPLMNGERLANAVARYTRDLHSRGEVLPPTITLDTLVGKGYLTAEDTKPLQGVKLIFHTDAVDTNPQMVLVEAQMPDGQMQAVLADGSVQQFSRSAWATVQKNVGQRGAAPNERQ